MTLSSQFGPLPSYKKPPINEVVCGMRFATPEKFRIPHIGSLWDNLRLEYPNIQHVQPIMTMGEIRPIDAATGFPIPRFWFINNSGDQLVQYQLDRFYFNWRRRQADYPRYPHVIQQFGKVLSSFDAFFSQYDYGEIMPTEYELTYINHIPKGNGWNEIEDFSDGSIFPDIAWIQNPKRFLLHPLKSNWTMEFLLPEMLGRLTVTMKHATRIEDKVPLLVLELSVRGTDGTDSTKDYRKWFDVAHEWIVRGFTDLTSPEIQKIWERE